jgi:hypothetical protein
LLLRAVTYNIMLLYAIAAFLQSNSRPLFRSNAKPVFTSYCPNGQKWQRVFGVFH